MAWGLRIQKFKSFFLRGIKIDLSGLLVRCVSKENMKEKIEECDNTLEHYRDRIFALACIQHGREIERRMNEGNEDFSDLMDEAMNAVAVDLMQLLYEYEDEAGRLRLFQCTDQNSEEVKNE